MVTLAEKKATKPPFKWPIGIYLGAQWSIWFSCLSKNKLANAKKKKQQIDDETAFWITQTNVGFVFNADHTSIIQFAIFSIDNTNEK